MRITINTDNAAFYEHSPSNECARILRKLADRLEEGHYPQPGDPWPMVDSNGNTVGKAEGGRR